MTVPYRMPGVCAVSRVMLLLTVFCICDCTFAQVHISVENTWEHSGTLQNQMDGKRSTFVSHADGTLEVRPTETIIVSCAMKYGVLPSRVTDDIIYNPNKFPAATELHVPVENVFMGLLEGEDQILICAWPDASPNVKLLLSENVGKGRLIRAVEIDPGTSIVYLDILAAPGIWHDQPLTDDYLETATEIDWKRPHPAVWKTQLLENGRVEISYPFKEQKGRSYHPTLGSFPWPAWFEGDRAFLHLSKKVLPVGIALIYALEGHTETPIEFAKRHVGTIASLQKPIDLVWPHRPTGVFACNGRDFVERVFRANLQVRENQLLQEIFDDFEAESTVCGGRLLEYQLFIERIKCNIISWQQSENNTSAIESYLSELAEDARHLESEYRRIMGKRMAPQMIKYEAEGFQQLRSLSKEHGLEVYAEVKHLLLETNGTADQIEKISAVIGGQAMKRWIRRLTYRCVFQPAVLKYAQEMRKEITEFLSHEETWEAIY